MNVAGNGSMVNGQQRLRRQNGIGRQPQIGDIVLLNTREIGVIRYYGDVHFDEGTLYFGVELKGPKVSGGHNGKL